MNKAIFLDKDGTLIHDLPYNVNPDLITWQDGVFEALRSLSAEGYLLVIVTNQSGVARGLFKEEDLLMLDTAMRTVLKEEGTPLGDTTVKESSTIEGRLRYGGVPHVSYQLSLFKS